MELNQCDAAILIGGESRRMKEPKALVEVHGKPMLEHIAQVISPEFARVFAVGDLAEARELVNRLRLQPAPDILSSRSSLNGVLSALYTSRSEWTAIFACDAPWPCISLLQHMCAVISGNSKDCEPESSLPLHAVLCVEEGGDLQPFHALWNRAAIPELQAAAEEGKLSLQRVLATLNTIIIGVSTWRDYDPAGEFLRNINTPDDLP